MTFEFRLDDLIELANIRKLLDENLSKDNLKERMEMGAVKK